jgi:LysM repeat protein
MPMRPLRVPALATLLLASSGVAATSLRAQNPVVQRDTTTHVAGVKHTVKRGDTLWDIAKYYLKDPFKWPEVFHANTDIVKNPHWIYPGQVLTIEASAVKPEIVARAIDSGNVVSQIQTRAQAPTVFSQGSLSRVAPELESIAKPPALTVRQGEFEAAPFVVGEHRPLGAGKIVGAVEGLALGLSSDAGYRLYDRIYVTGPATERLEPGMELIAAVDRATLADVGRVIEPRAVLRVDSVGARGLAIATIVRQFGVVVADQLILPLDRSFEPTTMRPVPGTYPTTAKVLWIQGEPALPTIQTYVVLGATSATGVRPGDRFTLFDDRKVGGRTDTPLLAAATATVVRVTPFGATALLDRQSQPSVREGMPARMTGKMP